MRRCWPLPSGLFRRERGVGEMMDRRSVRQTPPACVAGGELVERRCYANFVGEKRNYLNRFEFGLQPHQQDCPFSPFSGTDGDQFLNRTKSKSFSKTESHQIEPKIFKLLNLY